MKALQALEDHTHTHTLPITVSEIHGILRISHTDLQESELSTPGSIIKSLYPIRSMHAFQNKLIH